VKKEELTRLEELSRLCLTEEEREPLCRDMDALLALCQSLSDLSDETRDERELPSRTREDEPAEPMDREAILRSAPRKRDGFFVLP
jgi:aspartyl/glutamyl-tRNA(Asn/Gln) amidotransferase C subunit